MILSTLTKSTSKRQNLKKPPKKLVLIGQNPSPLISAPFTLPLCYLLLNLKIPSKSKEKSKKQPGKPSSPLKRIFLMISMAQMRKRRNKLFRKQKLLSNLLKINSFTLSKLWNTI
jgi:hypothetical protein